VEAPLDEMPQTIDYYLSSAAGHNKADQITQRGFCTLTESCRLSDCLRQLILDLHSVPKFPERFAMSLAEKPDVPGDLTPIQTRWPGNAIGRTRVWEEWRQDS